MKLWNKKNDKETRRLPMGRKSKRAFAAYAAVVLTACCFTTTAFAIGLILLGFGIVQIGLSLKSHDPSQRANGFLTLAGGVIITFAKEILTLITG